MGGLAEWTRFAVRSHEEAVVSSVAVRDFQRSLLAERNLLRKRAVVRAWNRAVDLVDQPDWSARDRQQWTYSRAVLRRKVTPDLSLFEGRRQRDV
jgi:hypothetical protein